jgi:rod shape-determining protein MreC
VGNAAIVTLITDEQFAVAARTLKTRSRARSRPPSARRADLILDFVSRRRKVDKGERIVTAGTTSSRLPSLFPPGIPIGRVRRIEDGAGDLDRVVHVKPAADMTNLQFVSVLTAPEQAALTASSGGP